METTTRIWFSPTVFRLVAVVRQPCYRFPASNVDLVPYGWPRFAGVYSSSTSQAVDVVLDVIVGQRVSGRQSVVERTSVLTPSSRLELVVGRRDVPLSDSRSRPSTRLHSTGWTAGLDYCRSYCRRFLVRSFHAVCRSRDQPRNV